MKHLPPDANLVFSGVVFDVYQWEQELYDGSTATFEKVVRADTVNVYPVLDDGRILLTKQEQPHLSPFIGSCGGVVDSGETPEAAAHRELLEESGIKCQELFHWNTTTISDRIVWEIHSYIAYGCTKVAGLSLDAGEKIEPYPLTFEQFLQLPFEPTFRDLETSYRIMMSQLQPGGIEKLRQLFTPKSFA